MREIKFRAWDKYAKEMVRVKTIDLGSGGAECAVDFSGINGEIGSEWDLEQFTGLYDKNGKEIYEGDIVEFPSRRGVINFMGIVVYENFCFNIEGFYDVFYDYPSLAFSEGNNGKVIGNIHENKELLDGGNDKD